MQRERRLRRRKDFAAAYRKGRVYGNQLLVLRVVSNASGVARFGFVAGRAVGGAVVRNRLKRRLRAAAMGLDPAPGTDIVVGVRRSAADASYHALHKSLAALMERARVLRGTAPAGSRENT